MADWKNDERLKLSLQNYVRQNIQRKEMLDFVTRDFPDYKWSFRSLCRRLQVFGIKYIERVTTVEEVTDAVKKRVSWTWEKAGLQSNESETWKQSQHSSTSRSCLCCPD